MFLKSKSVLHFLLLSLVWITACSKTSKVGASGESSEGPGANAPATEEESAEAKAQRLVDEATLAFNAKYVDKENKILGALPYFPVSSGVLSSRVDLAIQETDKRIAEVLAVAPEDITFSNTMKALDEALYVVNEQLGLMELLSEVTVDAAIKDAAREAYQKIEVWYVEYNARKDVYAQLKLLKDKNLNLKSDDEKLLDDTLLAFQNQGFHLPEAQQVELQRLKIELSDLTKTFDENLAEANKAVMRLSPKELGAISPVGLDQLEARKNAEGNYEIRLAIYSSDVLPILEYVPVEATRKKVYIARANRAKNLNSEIVAKIIQTRIKIARLLGEKSWAHYVMKDKMAQSPDVALPFVEKLSERLQPKLKSELAALKKLKKEETHEKKVKVEVWDVSYFERIRMEREFDFDPNSLKPYFEYQHVFTAMLNHYQRLFHIQIRKVEDAPYVWEKKVELYEMREADSEKFLGFLYLDMFPRPETEKYGHFAMFPIRSGIKFEKGMDRRPVASLVCNFPEPIEGKPALLSLDNVETLFHEFGHSLHQLLSQTTHTQQSGSNVPWDFVEAPSQFLEYFVTDPQALKLIAKHIEDGSTIPEETLENLKASKIANIGRTYARQMQFALGDLRLHTQLQDENVSFEDINKLYNDAAAEVYMPAFEGSAELTNFAHIMSGGYHAGYYGYSWSDVIAADLASKFEESDKGFFDETLGAKYRSEILERGSSRPILESIEAFLGRPFNDDAFLKKLGL